MLRWSCGQQRLLKAWNKGVTELDNKRWIWWQSEELGSVIWEKGGQPQSNSGEVEPRQGWRDREERLHKEKIECLLRRISDRLFLGFGENNQLGKLVNGHNALCNSWWVRKDSVKLLLFFFILQSKTAGLWFFNPTVGDDLWGLWDVGKQWGDQA